MSRWGTRAEAGTPVRIPLNIQIGDGEMSELVRSRVTGKK